MNYQPYLEAILDPEDGPLFEEAVESAKHGLHRGAYILTWLACAESIKRRFKLAAPMDNAAAKINGDISRAEGLKQSIDNRLIGWAQSYGFIDDADATRLENIYTKRCIFGHPYQVRPTEEEVAEAMSSVVNAVLKHPTLLRHGYLKSQTTDIIGRQNFLDLFEPAVVAYTNIVIGRAIRDLRLWWITDIWRKAEISVSSGEDWLRNRVAWISQAVFASVSSDEIRANPFGELLVTAPMYASYCLACHAAFPKLDDNEADLVVTHILNTASVSPMHLGRLTSLADAGVLNPRQKERLAKFISEADFMLLATSEIPLRHIFEPVVKQFKIKSWSRQNVAAARVASADIDELSALSESQLEILGRNVLQSAEGSAHSSINLIAEIAAKNFLAPEAFVRGVVLECFIDDAGQLRAKLGQISNVASLLESLPTEQSDALLSEIETHVKSAAFKNCSKYNGFDVNSISLETSVSRPDISKRLKDAIAVAGGRSEVEFRKLFPLS